MSACICTWRPQPCGGTRRIHCEWWPECYCACGCEEECEGCDDCMDDHYDDEYEDQP